LRARWRAPSKEGRTVDISCWDCLIDANRTALVYQAATGRDVQAAERHIWGSKHSLYRTRDDRLVFVALIEKKFWERF
jgi:crotonobetainyl-CoA:carnitine CoA-transferase CaiB-like acyl-CoA transferase